MVGSTKDFVDRVGVGTLTRFQDTHIGVDKLLTVERLLAALRAALVDLFANAAEFVGSQ
jgi:hypothetical protein